MKNKTSRVNKMKLKKAIVASLAIFILLAFTGCGTSSSLATTEHTKQEILLKQIQTCRLNRMKS